MRNNVITVLGLGYVGLPLAIEFGKKYKTYGYDNSVEKILNFNKNYDPTLELSESDFRESKHITFSNDPSVISISDIIVVAVPTPVDKARIPDFSPLISASIAVGENMKAGAVVVYESTVYPGATEEICIPLLEKHSGMTWKVDFHVGYSPERVSPGDKEHTTTKIVKVVAGDDENTLQKLGDLYDSIITAGVHRASSIKVAEAAKVIENTQRDLNIALMNELAILFHRIGIDTSEVLQAAGTKWNFLHFKPGLVGGHCIGVDPYYLTYKAEMLRYHPQVILAGRRINDGMSEYVAQEIFKKIIEVNGGVRGVKVGLMGLTFKENCPDLRNSKVADLIHELKGYGCDVIVHDPIASSIEAMSEYGINLEEFGAFPELDVLVLAVPHEQYLKMPIEALTSQLKRGGIFVDIKSVCSRASILKLGFEFWRL
jgi:UDP-N-acetyl-D-glucosamine/UDP-N-acetyl-D-galactosamine dehydrogenase